MNKFDTETGKNPFPRNKDSSNWLLDLSLRQKLIFIMLIIGLIAVSLSGATITAYQYLNFKTHMVENITTDAQVIGINSQAALAFDDSPDAETILSSLRAVPSVVYASLITEEGDLLASYQKQGGNIAPEPLPASNQAIFRGDWLLVVQDIYLGETQLVGQVFIQFSTEELDALLFQSVMVVVLIIMSVLIVGYFLASRLQHLVSGPILELTSIATQVTQNQDYSVRAKIASGDELGLLSRSFNVMMENISQRDQSLAEYRENLEQLVQERTQALEKDHTEILSKEKLAALGQLTATIAHEIRNPLGTVRTSIFALYDAVEKGQMDRIVRVTNLAEKSIQRCDNIITELLDYTRKRELKQQRENVDDWLNEFLDIQDIPKDIQCLRELNTSMELEFDQEHLRRAIANVVTNGIQALQEKEGDYRVFKISTTVEDGRLQIIVNDNGPGISDEVMERIFEPLYSNKSFGVGLGLPIVKGIMDDHRGGIHVSSEADANTTVVLWLPTNLGEGSATQTTSN